MLPYSQELFLRNPRNYGIMKTETVFGFGPPDENDYLNHSFNRTGTMNWIFGDGGFQKRSLQVEEPPTEKSITVETPKYKDTKAIKTIKEKKKKQKSSKKNSKRKSKKVNKCIIKFMNEGEGQQKPQKRKRKRERGQMEKMQKKYMMPVIIGLLAAKSVLIPIVLKALAFTLTKGLMMMLFSTLMASVVALKGIFSHNNYQNNRKDDAKTQVEIIQIPQRSEDHIYYDDEHIRKGDYDIGPIPYSSIGYIPNAVLNKKSSRIIDKYSAEPYYYGDEKGNFLM